MTLCIAAHTNLRGHPRIALCFDSLIGNEYGVSEAVYKCDREFAQGLVALWAGTLDQVQDALPVFRARFAARPPRLADCKEELWVGMKEFRAALGRRGVKRTDVQLIVAGFVEGSPRIICVEQDGVRAEPSYSVIGTGWPSADAMLRWRRLTKYTHLYDALYFLLEAKKFAETSPFVGKMTTMHALEPAQDNSFVGQTVSDKGMEFMHDRLNQFFLQPVPLEEAFPLDGLI